MVLDVPLDHAKIRRCREDRELSLSEAARRAGMSAQQWSNIESGRVKDPGISTVGRMARVLGVSLDELMSDDDDCEQ